ncbi:hypothetical protein [Xanthobacter aminoxidans]|uniref:hypothetical protein n=1 Tax=Xanthobacter aminoxidans TaxID=186280 RepID=UPI002022BAE3|nr:hypothetical protein [Xanthobacter aminoxidans]MCL8384061.1 hypothetical protein [Xanthobacter aminoxidans]
MNAITTITRCGSAEIVQLDRSAAQVNSVSSGSVGRSGEVIELDTAIRNAAIRIEANAVISARE